MEGEKAKEMRSELSQASFSDDSTLDNSSVAGKTVGQDLEDQHAEVTGLFKGSNEGAWRESFVLMSWR